MNFDQTIFAFPKRKRGDHVFVKGVPSSSLIAPEALNGFLISIDEVCDD